MPEMLDSPHLKAETCLSRALSKQAAKCLTRFSIENRTFQLVLLGINKDIRSSVLDSNELTRFKLCGRTLAVIEERNPGLAGAEGDILARLTERELQIAVMVAQGNGTKKIAHKLHISEWTVITHLRRIFAKLGVDNRAAMVYRCSGLIKSATGLAPPLAG